MQTRRYTHVLFDMDGTLLNTLDDLANACNYVCEQQGWPTFTLDEYRYKIGNGQPKLMERIIPAEFAGDSAVFERTLEAYRARYAEHCEDATAPYRGIPEVLDALRDAGVTLGVLSNKDHAATCALASKYFGERFAVVQGRVDAFPPKPAAPLTQHVLDLLGANPEGTLYVGDSNVDVACAHNAGLAACGAAWGFRGRAELEAAGADRIIEEPGELLAIVLEGR